MPPNLLAPFVGRAEELLILSDAFDAATAGQFVPVLVGGEAGIGKTRLVSEFVGTLPASTAVHWGRCVEDGGAASFWCSTICTSLTSTHSNCCGSSYELSPTFPSSSSARTAIVSCAPTPSAMP